MSDINDKKRWWKIADSIEVWKSHLCHGKMQLSLCKFAVLRQFYAHVSKSVSANANAKRTEKFIHISMWFCGLFGFTFANVANVLYRLKQWALISHSKYVWSCLSTSTHTIIHTYWFTHAFYFMFTTTKIHLRVSDFGFGFFQLFLLEMLLFWMFSTFFDCLLIIFHWK